MLSVTHGAAPALLPSPIVPATAIFREDGALYSPQYADIYASADGAIAEARHVFVAGNRLSQRWQGASSFVILEAGFGAGLNFLATWQAWQESLPTGCLHYVAVEKHPFRIADLCAIHARWPEVHKQAQALREAYPLLLPGMHRLHLEGGRLTLTLMFGDALALLPQLAARVDAFYLDGFAPGKNPDLWSAPLFSQIARLARPGATLATYSVAGIVRSGLSQAGFVVEKRPGFGSKREMLLGTFVARGEERVKKPGERRAIVIGAGLAGTACARALAQRGWEIDLIEGHADVAQEASGNPVGLLRPVLSADGNAHSRFTSAAFVYAQRQFAALANVERAWVQGGVVQLAHEPEHWQRHQQIIMQQALPPEFVQCVKRAQASDLAGMDVAGDGWWFPAGVWASPVAMCQENLRVAGAAVRRLFGTSASAIERCADGWRITGAEGRQLACAPVLILANARSALNFEPCSWLPLQTARGQVSLLQPISVNGLKLALCREGYVAPPLHGMACLGASYQPGDLDPQLRSSDHVQNLDRLEGMLPGLARNLDAQTMAGRVGFRTTTPDRLPLIGGLPCATSEGVFTDAKVHPGLFLCLGLGSRGMTWASLAAEILASQIEGEPLPMESALLALLEPARFLRRQARR